MVSCQSSDLIVCFRRLFESKRDEKLDSSKDLNSGALQEKIDLCLDMLPYLISREYLAYQGKLIVNCIENSPKRQLNWTL